jgi:hypothetical protein
MPQPANPRNDDLRLVRLRNENAAVRYFGFDRSIATRCHQQADVRTTSAHLAREVQAVEAARDIYIRKHDPDIVPTLQQVERFVAVAGAEHGIAVFFKGSGNVKQNPHVVLNHEDDRLPFCVRRAHIGKMMEPALGSGRTPLPQNTVNF